MKRFLLVFLIFGYSVGCYQVGYYENDIEKIFETDKTINAYSVSLFRDNIFFSDYSKNFYCYDLLSGELLWSVELEDNFYRRPLFTKNGLVLILDTGLLFYYSYSGDLIHKMNLGGRVKKAPIFYNNVIVSVRGVGILSINLRDFELDTLIESSEQLTSTQPVMKNDYLIVGDIKKELICYDLGGKLISWKYRFGEHSLQSNPTIVDDKVIVIWMDLATDNTYLTRLDINSGELESQIGHSLDINRQPVSDKEYIYGFGSEGSIVSFEKEDLSVKSIVDLESSLMTQVMIINHHLLFGTNNWKMNLYNGVNPVWRHEFNDGFGDPFMYKEHAYFSSGKALYRVKALSE